MYTWAAIVPHIAADIDMAATPNKIEHFIFAHGWHAIYSDRVGFKFLYRPCNNFHGVIIH